MKTPGGAARKPCSEERPSVSTAPAEGPADELSEEPPLGRVFWRAMRAIFTEERVNPELEALPMAQYRLLWSVHFQPDATMKDFARHLMVSQSTVTQLADRLVRRGIVERIADSTDRRVVRLRLSEAGQGIMGEANAQRRRMIQAIWNALSAQERCDVMRGLETLGIRGEEVRVAQGRPLPTWHEPGEETDTAVQSEGEDRPVFDIMARRVRGRVTP